MEGRRKGRGGGEGERSLMNLSQWISPLLGSPLLLREASAAIHGLGKQSP